MPNNFIMDFWLNENEDFGFSPQYDMSNIRNSEPVPNSDDANSMSYNNEDDFSNDPQYSDLPQDKPKVENFEVWKQKFFKEAIHGDANTLLSLLSEVKDMDLGAYRSKFVKDNWDIQSLRLNANIERASKEIRSNIKQRLDKSNPSTTLTEYITSTIQYQPTLVSMFIKLDGYKGLKGDLHRKYMAALLGAIQVGVGKDTEDIIYAEKDYSIRISTRCSSRWGDVLIGNWALREDDPAKYLSNSEMKRLRDGSPEERDVLRRRIVVESIANQFETRSFLIHVVQDDGTVHLLGWDIANCLRSAYRQGKLKVKTRLSDNSEASIDDNGEIVQLVEYSITYLKRTNDVDEDGKLVMEDIPFIEKRDGMLFLTADYSTISEISDTLQGMLFREITYGGNPSDVKTLRNCVYTAYDMLLKQC